MPLEILSCSTLGSSLPPKVFGCICYVHVPKFGRSKLDPKAFKYIFLGYALFFIDKKEEVFIED